MDNKNNEIWVFLSHSNLDYDNVRRVRDLLENDGFRPIMFYLKCLEDNKDDTELESFYLARLTAGTALSYAIVNIQIPSHALDGLSLRSIT